MRHGVLGKSLEGGPGRSVTAKRRRRGTAAVEFAVCSPLLFTILAGLWEVSRIMEVEQIVNNAARETARDASLAQDPFATVASNLLTYLQSAEPTAFPSGHSTKMISPVISLPTNTTGYTCWDQTANQELFTVSFADLTTTSVTDPTNMSQLDRFQIGVSVPYSSIRYSPLAQITSTTRLSATVQWVSMVDSPFQIAPYLPTE